MQTSEALIAFYNRVTPAIPELFNMAYAICGNYDLAEYALQYTLMEAWLGASHGGMGFREGLRNTLRRVALEEAMDPRESAPEMTWDGLTADSDDPLLKLLARESTETRRAAALRYGCGLNAARIARLTGQSPGRVRELLTRFERAAAGKLPAQQRGRVEAGLARSVRRAFDRADEEMPSLGALYRGFEAEALETVRPSHWASRLVKRALCAVLAVVCALAFWLAAVLMQPVQTEDVAPAAEESSMQEAVQIAWISCNFIEDLTQ